MQTIANPSFLKKAALFLTKSPLLPIWALLFGISTAFSFAPWNNIFLGLFGLGGFYALLDVRSQPIKKKTVFWIGYCYGLGVFTVGLYWISYSLFVDIERFWWVLPLSLFGLPAFLSCFTGGFALLFIRHHLKHPFARALWFAVSWTLCEWVRGHIFTGFPWNLSGHMWTPYLPILQLSSLFGIYGLSFLTSFCAASLFANRQRYPFWQRPLFTAVLLILAATLWGEFRLRTFPSEDTPIQLKLVQANIDQKRKWHFDHAQQIFQEYVELSRQGSTQTDFIIWPESALSWHPQYIQNDKFRRHILSKLLKKGAFLLSGTPRLTLDDSGEYVHNSMVALNHKGEVTAAFDKFHLVPFGEYFPLRTTLQTIFPHVIFHKITAGERDYTPGPGPRTLSTGNLPSFSPLICYEVIFPHCVTEQSTRPSWLLNLTNDGWYGDSAGPYQHLQIARLRSIEEGLPLVRSANTGISAVYDPLGRLKGQIPLLQAGYLDLPLPKPLPSSTFYADWGDLWLLMFALAFSFFVLRHHPVFNRWRKTPVN